MTREVYEFKAPILRARDISLTLGGNKILKDVNFDIMDVHRPGLTQGQVVGLLGPSGIGKTRLFRIIAGLDKPDTGEVRVGHEMKPVVRGDVGVVAQNYPLFKFRTLLANLVVAGRLGGMSAQAADAKAREYLDKFGLAGHEAKYPSQLSGGQRQRAAIAQQFMCSEHFLLMDEPFSGLDYNALSNVAAFITAVAATDELKTFLIVTHDITAALAVCDTIFVMGRDRDESGAPIPGAKIAYTYNLAEMGLAWYPDVATTPEFMAVLAEIRGLFPTL